MNGSATTSLHLSLTKAYSDGGDIPGLSGLLAVGGYQKGVLSSCLRPVGGWREGETVRESVRET